MVAPRLYRSDDPGAPVLTGENGTLIGVLDACLVSGYGTKQGAGWTKPFSGTNLAAYRMGAGGTAERMYLRVEDSTQARARVRGFVSMSDIGTGVEPFPTNGMVNGGAFVCKSTDTTNTGRPWVLVATPTLFVLHIDVAAVRFGQWTSGNGFDFCFGEYSYAGTGFVHNVLLDASEVNFGNASGFASRIRPFSTYIDARSGRYMARNFTNISGAVGFHKHVPVPASTIGSSVGSWINVPIGIGSLLGQPDPVSGQVFFVRPELYTGTGAFARMGYLPGVWVPVLADFLGEHMSRISGTGQLANQELLIVRTSTSAGDGNGSAVGDCQYALNLTDW